MNYFPVSGVSGKINVDGEKIDLKDIELVTTSAQDVMFALLPYNFSDGSVVVLGGEIHILGSRTYYNSWTYFDAHYKWKNGTWVQVSTLPYPFADGAAVVLNDEIHILGGYNGAYLGHYKWDGSTWTEVSTLPYAGRSVKAVVLNGEIHLLGAYDSPNTQKHYKWDGSTWTEVSTLPYGFGYGTAVVLNNEIHALGIANGDYHYKWDGSTWTKVSDMPFVSRYGSAVVLNDEIHFIGYSDGNKHSKWNGSTWEQLPNISVSGASWDFAHGGAAAYENGIHIIGGNSNNAGSKYHARLQVKDFVISVKKNLIDENEHKTITQLSDGERLLLGLLGKMVRATVSVNDAQNAQPAANIFRIKDASNISSVNCTIDGNTNYVYANIFGAMFNSLGTAERDTHGDTTFSVRVSESAYNTTQPAATVTINSFTTIDGKVHTADNLNY